MIVKDQYTYGQNEQHQAPGALAPRYHPMKPVAPEPALHVNRGRGVGGWAWTLEVLLLRTRTDSFLVSQRLPWAPTTEYLAHVCV